MCNVSVLIKKKKKSSKTITKLVEMIIFHYFEFPIHITKKMTVSQK